MPTIQHPYDSTQTIDLGFLLSLIDHELESLRLNESTPQAETALLNDLLAGIENPVEKKILNDAIFDRYVGD